VVNELSQLDRLRSRAADLPPSHAALYYRVPRPIKELRISHEDGSYIKILKSL
jgi:hypothetical protein